MKRVITFTKIMLKIAPEAWEVSRNVYRRTMLITLGATSTTESLAIDKIRAYAMKTIRKAIKQTKGGDK